MMTTEPYEKLTYRQTEDCHSQQREILFEAIEYECRGLGIKAREIALADAKQAELWKSKHKPGRAASWNWTDLYYQYHQRGGARRLDLAVHKNQQLLGLVYGMLERNRLILKVHAMESNPQTQAIKNKMLEITLFAANAFAGVNDASEIRLCNPVSPAHVRLYQGKGYKPYFDHFDNCTHLSRRIK